MATIIKTIIPFGVNKIQLECDGGPGKFMMACGFFADAPKTCKCGSGNILPVGKKSAGYDFYSILCLDCKSEMKYGQRKEDNGLFLKQADGWADPYTGGGGGGGGGNTQPRQQQQPDRQPDQGGGGESDDIPF